MSGSKSYSPIHKFAAHANVSGMKAYRELEERARRDPDKFWGDLAHSELSWFSQPSTTLEWDPPRAKWFSQGRINACYNCVDLHLTNGRKGKTAILWEGEPGDERTITYEELHVLVSRFANALKHLGCSANDRAIIYMPMVPELAIALLACARLGVIHSVVFGGFSAEALRARIQDLDARIVITADGGWRRGKEVRLKSAVDEALEGLAHVRHVVVFQRTGSDINMKHGRDIWWHDAEVAATLNPATSGPCDAVELDSEHPLFVLYTSGTTG